MNWISVKQNLPEVYHDSLDEGSDYILGWSESGNEKIKLVRYRHDWNKFVDVNNKEVLSITHWCKVTPPDALKGRNVFTNEELREIRQALMELRDTEPIAQKSKRELLLRQPFNFYITDFLPKHKNLVTDYNTDVGMEAHHLDELIKAGIINKE